MDRADVIIFGGGMVGLALASALDCSGLSAILVDPADPGERSTAAFDGRTSAVSSSSMRMLTTIGVAAHLAEPGCPIRQIAVADGLEPGGLHFEPDDDEPLGWMHENRHLRAALFARAEAASNAWLLWKSKVAGVTRDEHGVTVSLEDGRVHVWDLRVHFRANTPNCPAFSRVTSSQSSACFSGRVVLPSFR